MSDTEALLDVAEGIHFAKQCMRYMASGAPDRDVLSLIDAPLTEGALLHAVVYLSGAAWELAMIGADFDATRARYLVELGCREPDDVVDTQLAVMAEHPNGETA